MVQTMWWGTLYDTTQPGSSTTASNGQMQLVPVPDTGMDAGASGYSEQISFENGGTDVVQSAQTHREYKMDWGLREASGAAGLDIIKYYQQKYYGPGLIYFANPANFQTNMFAPHFAYPGLIEQGWKNTYDTTPTFANTAANTFGFPKRTATYTITASANTAPVGVGTIQVIPIHPSYTLRIAAVGSSTGSANVFVRPINLDGSYASLSSASVSAVTFPTWGGSWAGSTYKAVEVFLGRASATASTISISGLMAQEHITGYSPANPSVFFPGQGDMGCRFASEAIAETYQMIDPATNSTRHYKGMSADLVEVGSWAF